LCVFAHPVGDGGQRRFIGRYGVPEVPVGEAPETGTPNDALVDAEQRTDRHVCKRLLKVRPCDCDGSTMSVAFVA
jgi:hypothetical protein